jgi:hypothetical protein
MGPIIVDDHLLVQRKALKKSGQALLFGMCPLLGLLHSSRCLFKVYFKLAESHGASLLAFFDAPQSWQIMANLYTG